MGGILLQWICILNHDVHFKYLTIFLNLKMHMFLVLYSRGLQYIHKYIFPQKQNAIYLAGDIF